MNEITIFNPVRRLSIVIKDNAHVIIHPHNYEDVPYFELKLLNGLNFLHHKRKCKDCSGFLKDFGTDTLDWYLKFQNKHHRLDLSTLGGKGGNIIKMVNAEYEYGTVFKLHLSTVPVEKTELEELLNALVLDENFEKACEIRDLLNQTV